MIALPPRLRHLLGLLLAIAGAGYLLVHVIESVRLATATPPIHSDFHAIWSYARIAWEDGARAVYDPAHLWQAELALGRDPARPPPLPFAYPPHFLLLIAPLAWLDYAPGYLAWIVATAALFVVASAGLGVRGLLLLLAPATAATLIYGQSGFLAAALIVGGMRVVPTRPVLAGVLLGLATYKPQLGLLVPVALLALGQWRVMTVSCMTVGALALATSALWGGDIWGVWLAGLPEYRQRFSAEMGPYWYLMPTVEGTWRGLGGSDRGAHIAQLMVAIPVAGLVWWLFRRASYTIALAGMLVGTFLVTPHAFVYDLPLMAAAILLYLHTLPSSDTPSYGAALLVIIAPAVVLATPSLAPLAVIAHAILFLMILRTGGLSKSVL